MDCPHLSNNHSLLSCLGCPQHFALLSIPILSAFFAALKLTALSLPLHPSGYKGWRLPAGRQNPTGTEGRWLQGPGGPAVCSPPLTVSTRLHPISAPSNGCPPKPGFSLLSFFFPSLQSGGASCWLSGENSKGTTFQGA